MLLAINMHKGRKPLTSGSVLLTNTVASERLITKGTYQKLFHAFYDKDEHLTCENGKNNQSEMVKCI